MKNRILALLLTALLALSAFALAEEAIDTEFVFLEDVETEAALPEEAPEAEPQAKSAREDFTWTGSVITGYTGPGGKVVISKDWGATAIGQHAFEDNATITSLSIPGTVQVIDDFAFYEMPKLKSVTLAEGVRLIGNNAFLGCTALTTVKLPKSIRSIGSAAFMYCSALKSINFPDGLTRIGDSAFVNCTALTTAKLPDTLVDMGIYIFSGCEKLKTVTLSKELACIRTGTFPDCALSSIKLPTALEAIEAYAFTGCQNLTSVVVPECVYEIGEMAFAYCTKLKSVTLPDLLTDFGEGIFESVPATCTFNVYLGSDAHRYCADRGFKIAFRKEYDLGLMTDALQEMDVDTEYVFTPISTPDDYGYAKYTFKGSNAKVATVTSDGHVMTLQEGALTVSCTMEIKNPLTGKALVKKTASSKHKVVDPKKLTGVKITWPAVNTLTVSTELGPDHYFDCEIFPRTVDPVSVTWKSSNTKVVTLNDIELIPVGKGTATVTITATQGKIKKSASVKIKVVDPGKLVGVTAYAETPSVKVDEMGYVVAYVAPIDLEGESIKWTLSNSSLAEIEGRDNDELLQIRGRKKGTVTATCTVTKDGVSKKSSVKIKVVE